MMPLRQKIFAFMMAVIILVTIFELVRKRKLREEYSWLWIITGVSILLVVWRYDLLVRFTHFIGAFWPTSTLFLLGLLFLMLINLHYSVKISGLTNQVKILSQEITLLKGELTGMAQPPEEESDDG
jgi:hypothetical protein